MAVTFNIPGALRSFAGGRSQVEIEAPAATVSDALQALWVVCPGMRDRVVTEQGQLREHINVFVGNEDVRYAGGLATPVVSGAEISIVPAISGGVIARRGAGHE
jgi:sulfur-carrier protein